MSNYDENIRFDEGSDSGQADSDSIQPIGVAEKVWQDVTNRPLENLRQRTEILRRVAQDLMYMADYDRSLIIRSNASLTLTEADTGKFELSISGDDLFIFPTLTPGYTSGGRTRGGRVFVGGLPYSGTALVNDLILTADQQYTGQRGYYDADDFATTYSLSLGANRIEVDLVADGTMGTNVFSATVSQTPKTKIVIKYGTNGGASTLSSLIAWINADLTSQGAYGVAMYLRASTTASSPSSVSPTAFTGGIVQGAYDAEAHKVTAAQLAAFFAATEGGVNVNRLRDGEGLAIGYPKGLVETGVAAPRGGRRQSIYDVPTDRVGGRTSNITPASGWALFNTGREPEKIPGSIPIGKMLNGEFVFIDGTRIAGGETLHLGESRTLIAALADQTFGAAGASLIGYDGSGSWNSDASASANPSVDPGTVNDALDAIVAHLAASAATNSGARRVGAEAVTGVVTTGNRKLSLSAGSIRQQIAALLNSTASSSVAGGVNTRVSEDGHELKGQNAINKDFTALTNGAARFRAFLRGPSDLTIARSGKYDYTDLTLMPMKIGAGTTLNLAEPVSAGALSYQLKLSAGDIGSRFTGIWSLLATYTSTQISDPFDFGLIPMIFVKVEGLTSPSGDENTIYIFIQFTSDSGPTLGTFSLRKLDGTVADFSAVTSYSGATATFLSGHLQGDTDSVTKIALHQPPGLYPAMVVGAAARAIPWAEVLTAPYPLAFTPGSGMQAVKGSVFYPARAVWDMDLVPRDTNNILATGDKVLLDGVETGSVVDASSSHHHGSMYTKIAWHQAEITLLDRSDLGSISTGTWHALTTPATAGGGLATIPAGYTVVGWLLHIIVQTSVTSGTYVNSDLVIDFRANTGDALPMYLTAAHAVAIDLVNSNDAYQESTVPLPIGGGGDISWKISSRANCTFGRLIVNSVGYLLRRT